MDNVFIERLWRSLKHEDVYLKEYADGRDAKVGIAEWIASYNNVRPRQALANRTPMAVWREGYHRRAQREGCGYDAALGQRSRVAHIPTAAATGISLRFMMVRMAPLPPDLSPENSSRLR
jgi:transposase InsO family protein